jgi:hypothetical protein
VAQKNVPHLSLSCQSRNPLKILLLDGPLHHCIIGPLHLWSFAPLHQRFSEPLVLWFSVKNGLENYCFDQPAGTEDRTKTRMKITVKMMMF